LICNSQLEKEDTLNNEQKSFNENYFFPLITGLNESCLGLFFKCQQERRLDNSKDQILNCNINCTSKQLAGILESPVVVTPVHKECFTGQSVINVFSEGLNAKAAKLLYNY